MSIIKERVHNFLLQYEEDMLDGVKYLRDDLQEQEAKTIFDAAHFNGSAEFEDDTDRDWTLLYNRGDGTYTLIRLQDDGR